jgi:hypothetical protein
LTGPTAFDQTFCTDKAPLTEGNGAGLGFSGALEQADKHPMQAKASQRVQVGVSFFITWCFL